MWDYIGNVIWPISASRPKNKSLNHKDVINSVVDRVFMQFTLSQEEILHAK